MVKYIFRSLPFHLLLGAKIVLDVFAYRAQLDETLIAYFTTVQTSNVSLEISSGKTCFAFNRTKDDI